MVFIHSNTTLVKVKYIPNGPALGKTPYSNTTLVKVKLKSARNPAWVA